MQPVREPRIILLYILILTDSKHQLFVAGLTKTVLTAFISTLISTLTVCLSFTYSCSHIDGSKLPCKALA